MENDLTQLRREWRAEPLRMAAALWPKVVFYDKQVEVIHSVRDNVETIVPAGNMLGKDFVTGFIVLWYFITGDVVRIITTSVKDDHLRVLWGEIGMFVRTCQLPLRVEDGGPLIINHHDIKRAKGSAESIAKSYLRGMVAGKGESMAGHHAPETLFVGDEASGLEDVVITQADTWAKKKLLIGNPNPCNNYFRTAVEEGDLEL